MKTKYYCFAIILFMAVFSNFSAQQYTLTLNNKTINSDEPPIYNLFYLSKLIANKNLNNSVKTKAYYALNSLLPNVDIKTNSRTFEFINTIREHHKNQFKKSLTENPENFEKNYRTILSSEKNLNEEFDKIKNILCLKTLNKNIDTLKNSYDKKNYDIISGKFKCQTKQFTVNKKVSLAKKELLQKITDIDSSFNDEYKNKIDTLKIYSNKDYQKIKTEFKKVSINLDNFLQKDIFYIDKEKLITEVNSEIKKLETNEKPLDEKIDLFLEKIINLYLDKNHINNLLNNISNITTSSTISTPQQIIINSQIQTAQAQTGASGISIPSQSQMIEAMAIFLAKRAKQEAAIWFMDQIRLKMNNPMILDVFPETIKVLDGVESYKVPTFNTTWKYAIAKDFVEMPKNLVNSPWVENVIFKDNKNNHTLLKQSVEFGYDMNRLMTEQYNYRDIIKYLYINPRTEKDKTDQEVNRLIDNSTTFLYIITNEFFAIENIDGKDVYRLLSYEEIAGLNEQEFKILVELIDLKYGGKFTNFKILENVKLENREEIGKWIGNILISLSQFDKIRTDFQNKKEEIKDNLATKNFYNVWSILNQVTENITNCSFFDKNDKEKEIRQKIKMQIKYIQTGMSVYEHFQNNDYVGAANQTFELVNLITLNSTNVTPTSNLNFEYTFDDSKKIILNSISENEFVIKTENNDVQNHITVSFANNNLVVKKGKEDGIIVENYLILAKYIVNSTSKKRIKDFYNKETFESFEKILKLSKELNIEETEMLQLINSIYLAKITNNINQNVAQVLISKGFTIKNKTDNIFKASHSKYYKQLTNLLSFFGDVLTVKDEHQLAGVIDSYALPPTSYKLKRKQPSSIDLNAYVGAFGGILSTFKSSTVGTQAVYGITAPIGIAFTWSRDGWYDNYGFTVDVVDLGNVVNHYLVKPGEDYAKDVHFSEVFSLGTTFLMGIKNSPFVLSGGFRLQPFNTGKDQNNKVFDAGIFHLGVKIDIPLIHLSGKDF